MLPKIQHNLSSCQGIGSFAAVSGTICTNLYCFMFHGVL